MHEDFLKPSMNLTIQAGELAKKMYEDGRINDDESWTLDMALWVACEALKRLHGLKENGMKLIDCDLNNWLDFDTEPPPKELTFDFVSWSGRDGFCRFTYWSPKHQEYIDIETGEDVHPDFWLPLFPPNHKRYNHKYILSERTLSPEELEAMYGHTMKKFLERQ